jgi:hypothetical protein
MFVTLSHSHHTNSQWITCNYPTFLKEKNMEKQKEYNLRYLLAKFRTT